ncbi:MAG: protein TolR [Rickettsiales bacterium]|jgi:biopolymer transport protein TolR|nr:protein TolR [Rickettsiales bacterium]OUW70577.1 MAG: protein TolR [Rickettsiales bacterium TMED211]
MAINLKRKNRKFKEPISEINVTPFVDVMLVLLIIFMVTAPLLTTGVKVNLPESSSKVLSEKDKTVTVTINKKKEIFIQKKKLTQTEMIKKLFELKKQKKELKIYIKGDKDLNYGEIMKVMGNINKAGFKKVALVTKLK